MGFRIKRGYSVTDFDWGKDCANYAFFTLKDLREYFKISPSQLATWREKGECPEDSDMSDILPCIIVEREEQKKEKPFKEIYSFRTSHDGDHWNRDERRYFSSIEKLAQYVELYVPHISNISDEELQAFCERLRKDQYAKWVNSEDKKEKLYVLIDSLTIDNEYE